MPANFAAYIDIQGRILIDSEMRANLNISKDTDIYVGLSDTNDYLFVSLKNSDSNFKKTSLDAKGRMLIPSNYRKLLKWNTGLHVKFSVINDTTFKLTTIASHCVFCQCLEEENSDMPFISYKGQKICADCMKNLFSYLPK